MSDAIQRWQTALPGDKKGGESASESAGLAARLTTVICLLYKHSLDCLRPGLSRPSYRRLEQPYDYLRLWSDGYGVPSGDLDGILDDSKRLRRSTLRLLLSICRTLTTQLVPFVEKETARRLHSQLLKLSARAGDIAATTQFSIADGEDGESESDSDDDPDSGLGGASVEDIAEDLKTDVQCLVDLGPRYDEPIRDRAIEEKEAPPPTGPTAWNPAEYLASRIRHRYPEGEDGLLTLLGYQNWDRLQALYAVRESNRETAQKPEMAETPAGEKAGTEFHDSGLGTSIVTPSSYAETVVSYHGSKGGPIRIPPLPAEAAQGKSFRCPVCGQSVQISTTSRWKRHVLLDLQPYRCIIPSCRFGSTPFADKKLWAEHLELEHDFGESWTKTCGLCQEDAGGSTTSAAFHLARHLEEVSLMVLPPNAGNDDDEGPLDIDENESLGDSAMGGDSVRSRPRPPGPPPPGQESLSPTTAAAKRLAEDAFTSRYGRVDPQDLLVTTMSPNTDHATLLSPETEYPFFFDDLPPPEFGGSNGYDPFEQPLFFTGFGDEDWFPLFPQHDNIPVDAPSLFGPTTADAGELNTIPAEVTSPTLFIPTSEPPVKRAEVSIACDVPGCGGKFRTQKDRHRHQIVRHGPKSGTLQVIKCQFPPCPYQSRRMDNLARHMKKYHDKNQRVPKPAARDQPASEADPEPAPDAPKPDSDTKTRRRDKPLPPIIVDDPENIVTIDRVRADQYARALRERGVISTAEIEEKIEKLEAERDVWKKVALERNGKKPQP